MATTIVDTAQLRHSVAVVLDRLRDPVFVRHHAAANSTLPGRLTSHRVEGRRIEIEIVADVPDRWLPERVRALMTVRPALRRVSVWDAGSGVGDAVYHFTGVLAHARAQMHLAAHGAGSRLVQSLTLSVPLPLVGRLVEQSVARHIAPGMRSEALLHDEPLGQVDDDPGAAR